MERENENKLNDMKSHKQVFKESRIIIFEMNFFSANVDESCVLLRVNSEANKKL